MRTMSNNEVAAWLKAHQDLRDIESELAGLEWQLKQTGEALRSAGQMLVKSPNKAETIDTRLLSEALKKAEEQVKRYKRLAAERTRKRSEIEELDLSA